MGVGVWGAYGGMSGGPESRIQIGSPSKHSFTTCDLWLCVRVGVCVCVLVSLGVRVGLTVCAY